MYELANRLHGIDMTDNTDKNTDNAIETEGAYEIIRNRFNTQVILTFYGK